MSPDEARMLFLEHCEPGDRGTLERYGEKAAVAAIMTLSVYTDDIKTAAYILKQYAEFIRLDVKANDLERHPYLPLIEQTIANLSTSVSA